MSWTDDEKRAALALLSRIAEALDRVAVTPEEFARIAMEADRIRASHHNDAAPVLTIAGGSERDTAPIDVSGPDFDDRIAEHHAIGQCPAKLHDTCCIRLRGHYGEHRNYFGQWWPD